jgi:hypothetical protein
MRGAALALVISMLGLAPSACATDSRGQRMSTKIERRKDGEWVVRVTRSQGAASKTGSVVIRQATEPSAAAPPHVALAAARAWLALGNDALAAKHVDAAIQSARAGLAELGNDYAPPDVDDDSGLKLHAADELIHSGKADNGAAMMLRMLSTRIQLYLQRYGADVVE